VDFSDEQLVRAWHELPDGQRLTLYLIDVELLDEEKVAEIMDRPVAIVIKEVGRARALVKKKLLLNYKKERISLRFR
jgi:DNA-directed RNA polymerase specialized sigma24 family protein